MKNRKNAISLALGTALVGTLVVAPVVSADSNPFSFNDLGNGYMVADAGDKVNKDGSCGESKCGDKKPVKKMKKDGSCGESKCGDNKAKEKAKEAGKKSKDGSCGESKCGDKKA
jgi:uncharacterized low-complexity protein